MKGFRHTIVINYEDSWIVRICYGCSGRRISQHNQQALLLLSSLVIIEVNGGTLLYGSNSIWSKCKNFVTQWEIVFCFEWVRERQREGGERDKKERIDLYTMCVINCVYIFRPVSPPLGLTWLQCCSRESGELCSGHHSIQCSCHQHSTHLSQAWLLSIHVGHLCHGYHYHCRTEGCRNI